MLLLGTALGFGLALITFTLMHQLTTAPYLVSSADGSNSLVAFAETATVTTASSIEPAQHSYSATTTSYTPDYAIIGVQEASRKHLPAAAIPGSRWYEINLSAHPMKRETRQAMQREHAIAALTEFLPDICPVAVRDDSANDNSSASPWFLWLEDDVFPFPGSLLRVGAIIAAIQERYDDAGRPAFVRLGVGLTAALFRCTDARTGMLQHLQTTNDPIDEAIAELFVGRTLTHEVPLFGHDDELPSTVQDEGLVSQKYNRVGNWQGRLQLSTNLVHSGTPMSGQGFDLARCLGYAWTPCPTSGDIDEGKSVWAPTSDQDWWGSADRLSTASGSRREAEPRFTGNASWAVVFANGRGANEDCNLVCERYGSSCDEAGLMELNNPLTFRERAGLNCDVIFYRPSFFGGPVFDRQYDKKVWRTVCFLNLLKPLCKWRVPGSFAKKLPENRRICACTPLSILKYEKIAAEIRAGPVRENGNARNIIGTKGQLFSVRRGPGSGNTL